MVRILLDNGADIDAKDTMGRTPLFYALLSENIHLVKVDLYLYIYYFFVNNKQKIIYIKELLYNKCSPWTGD